jgi:hypothetical protein
MLDYRQFTHYLAGQHERGNHEVARCSACLLCQEARK